MKVCTKCNIEKPESSFGFKDRSIGKRASHCKQCHSEYTSRHYRENAEYYKTKKRDRRREISDWLREYKESRPCTDCGQYFPACVMDFDHLADKSFNVSRGLDSGSRQVLLAEMAKCELVCANCHRMRTHSRLTSRVIPR